jgi:hypothetical protein
VTRITLQDGKIVLRDGKVGTEEACCCEQQCDCSSAGFEPAIASDAERGLVWLEFSACIGDGAVGTVDAPAATSPCDFEGLAGPITGVTLTNGGGGYARLGRVAPTISPSVSGGSGATFSVALEEKSEFLGDECLPVPYWEVDSVAVTAAGSGYSDGAAVTFTAAAGDTTIESAAGRAYVEIDEPVEQFSITSSGSGAVLEAVWQALPDTDWLDSRTPDPCPAPPKTTYRLMSVNVVSGGSGYSQFDLIEITFASPADGVVAPFGAAFIDVDSVDGNGAITGVFVAPDDGNFIAGPAGRYAGSETDRLASVVVNSCVANGQGHYYREDSSVPPYVADVAVTVQQEEPSTGVGAVVTAEVDDDTASATFGHVISLTLVDGGTEYLQVALACQLPDKLYVTWGGITEEVPLVSFDNQQNPTLSDFVCDSGGECRGGGWNPEDRGAGFACYWAFTPRTAEDAGNLRSYAIGILEKPACKCGGFIHLSVRYVTFCDECVYGRIADAFAPLTTNTDFANNSELYADCGADEPGFFGTEGNIVGFFLPGHDSLFWRTNFSSSTSICLKFEVDEDGCPIGDAVVVSIDRGNKQLFNANSCVIFSDPETDFEFGGNPDNGECPCLDSCDEPIVPEVSFMP